MIVLHSVKPILMLIPNEQEKSLFQYIPPSAHTVVMQWINHYPVYIRIVNRRNSKAGDYRYTGKETPARITINRDENKYRFLFVLTHELAHHISVTKADKRIKPHGKEWKENLFEMLLQLQNEKVFPEDITLALPTSP
ncbi:MAG: SprT-like domain-containing protein, partial [Bacteroidales bacterium]